MDLVGEIIVSVNTSIIHVTTQSQQREAAGQPDRGAAIHATRPPHFQANTPLPNLHVRNLKGKIRIVPATASAINPLPPIPESDSYGHNDELRGDRPPASPSRPS
jgi:hypothetical protein